MWKRSEKIAGKKYCCKAAVITPRRRLPLVTRTLEKIFERT